MTRTCYVHIGMMKTGSTSIQAAFHGYDDGSLRYLPYHLRNHSTLLRNVLKDRPDPTLKVLGKGHSDEELNDIRRRERRQFRAWLSEDSGNLIISSEELTTGFGKAKVARLLRLIGNDFDDVKVIAYVREPISFMSSIFQQRTKLGRDGLVVSDLYPSYRRLFGKWLDAVGRDGIDAIQFNRSHFRHDDLVKDFASRVQADPSRLSEQPAELNQALTAEALAVLYVFRKERGSPRDDTTLARHNGRALRFLQHFGARRFEIDYDLCAREVERRRSDIEFVEDLMGSKFEYQQQQRRNSVVFATEHDVIEHARATTPDLLRAVRSAYPDEAREVSTLVDAMDLVYRTRPARPGPGADGST